MDDRDRLYILAANIAGLFADSEARVQSLIAARVRRGLSSGDHSVAVSQLRSAQLRRDTAEIVEKLSEATSEQVGLIMRAATEQGSLAALRELSEQVGAPDITRGALPSVTAPAAEAITATLTSTLTDVSKRLLRLPDDVYRAAVGGAAPAVAMGTASGLKAAEEAWQTLISQGVTSFTDVAGRTWSLSSYVEMATRTAVNRGFEEQHQQTLADNGVDLVTIMIGWTACRRCAFWQGKVLRTSAGPTGAVMVASSTGIGQVEVYVEGTLDDARAAGWQHPNCTCRTVGYLPGISEIQVLSTYDPQKAIEQQQLRAMERSVRRAKTELASAVSDDQVAAAKQRIREVQGKIRQHVDATGISRQRYREQVNLGFRSSSQVTKALEKAVSTA